MTTVVGGVVGTFDDRRARLSRCARPRSLPGVARDPAVPVKAHRRRRGSPARLPGFARPPGFMREAAGSRQCRERQHAPGSPRTRKVYRGPGWPALSVSPVSRRPLQARSACFEGGPPAAPERRGPSSGAAGTGAVTPSASCNGVSHVRSPRCKPDGFFRTGRPAGPAPLAGTSFSQVGEVSAAGAPGSERHDDRTIGPTFAGPARIVRGRQPPQGGNARGEPARAGPPPS